MTTINLHGLLAQEYQKQFVLKVGKAKDVIRAIDCNRKGFLRRVNDLIREGVEYDIVVNRGREPEVGSISKDIEEIDLVPVITGAVMAAAAVLARHQHYMGVRHAGGKKGIKWKNMHKHKKAIKRNIKLGQKWAHENPDEFKRLYGPGGKYDDPMLYKYLTKRKKAKADVGGSEGTDDEDQPVTFESRASVASMIFNNMANLASQGSPVPIGYGRLLIGSQVVQGTVKSFPMSQRTARAFLQNPFNIEDEAYSTDMQQIYTARDTPTI